MGDLQMIQENQADAIQFYFESPHCPGTHDIDVFVPSLGAWSRVERESRLSGIQCGPWGWGAFARLTTDFGFATPGSLLDTDGILRMRAEDITKVYTRAISYSREYQFATIDPVSASHSNAMILNRDQIWVVRSFADASGDPIDSLLILGLDGARQYTHVLPNLRIMSMCQSSSGEVWAVAYESPYRFVTIDEYGEVRASFVSTYPCRSDIAWWDDQIWHITGDVGSNLIIGIDVGASLDSGYAILKNEYAVDFSDLGFDAFFIEDGNLHGIPHREDSLWCFTFQGEVLEKWPLPVVGVASGARDDSSLWLLHHGPPEAQTDGVLLSRFRWP
jgi:hypothetical protein